MKYLFFEHFSNAACGTIVASFVDASLNKFRFVVALRSSCVAVILGRVALTSVIVHSLSAFQPPIPALPEAFVAHAGFSSVACLTLSN